MNLKFSVLGVFLLVIHMFSLSSCKKNEVDETRPVISEITEPLMNDTLFSGSEFHVKLKVSDNEELSQLKIDIHSAEDGHSHGKVDASSYWETVVIVNLSGKEQLVDEHIDIPIDAASGLYHVILTAVDKSGNMSEVSERDIFIQNSGDLIAPLLTIQAPTEGATLAAGSDLNVQASITDNLSLNRFELKVYKGTTLVSDTDMNISGTEYTLNQTLSTAGWTAGNYTIELLVFDEAQNASDVDLNFVLN
jgi:uncharacterized membrane protein